MKVKNIYNKRSKCTGPIFVMMEGIVVDITQSMARIVVNGKDLPFRSVSTSVWNQGPVNDLIVSTNQRVEEFFSIYVVASTSNACDVFSSRGRLNEVC